MSSITRRPSNTPLNILTATGGIATVLACLALIDERVREQLTQIVSGHGATTEVGGAVASLNQSIGHAISTGIDVSLWYTPLTVFGIAALVLLFFMTRT
jgi:hypothetical protein